MQDVLISRNKAVTTLQVYASMRGFAGDTSGAYMLQVAAKRITAMTSPGWIRVSDEEPPEGHWVLGYRDGVYAQTRIFDHDYDGEAFWSGAEFAEKPPTHWVELPLGPNEQKDTKGE